MRLVLDPGGHLGQGFRVFLGVVGTEEKLSAARESDPEVGLRTAAIAAVGGGQCGILDRGGRRAHGGPHFLRPLGPVRRGGELGRAVAFV
ncbi:hypothetical protein SDC9_121551 [bioreactor metagenome]|uniref:Uncharacterized protein n=1 Tax=bioreactor metagenome TaxID=1076179 RepID=A0A645CCB5_9ZZZZ